MKTIIKLKKPDYKVISEYKLNNIKKVVYRDNLVTFCDRTDFGANFMIDEIKEFEVKESRKRGKSNDILVTKEYIFKVASELFPEMYNLEFKNGKYYYTNLDEAYAVSKDMMVYNIIEAFRERAIKENE